MTNIGGTLSANLRGIILMVLATMLLTSMSTMVRHVAENLHPFEVAFMRNFIGLFMLAPILFREGLAPLKTNKLGLMAVRGVFNAAAMMCYFLALGLMPLAELSALSFTVPLFVALLAVPFLGERLGPRRIASLVIGFSGAVIILRPGFETVGVGAALAVGSSASWAIAVIAIKRMSATDSPVTITIYGMLFLALFTLIPALFFWRWPTLDEWAWLIAIAALGTAGQLLFAHSMKSADASLVMPFDFTKLIWASAFGIIFFAEIPTVWTFVGGAVIFGGATYISYREGRAAKALQGKAAGPVPTLPV
ncbi:MAG: DMT family transporter [Rhodospirillales bacterium]|nr:DMT family transporter [Rhodospirillales bacterium]